MDWTNTTVLELIHIYEKYPVIWNPNHPDYKNRKKLYGAWMGLQKELTIQVPLYDIKRKIESLRASYRTIRKKMADSQSQGKSTYTPAWFAFDVLDRFLDPVTKKVPLEDTSNDTAVDSYLGDEDIKSEPQIEITDIVHYEDEEVSLDTSSFVYGKRRRDNDDENQEEIIKRVKFPHDTLQTKTELENDACSLYGKLLADKLRVLTYRSRVIVQNKIDNLIFEAQMAEMPPSEQNTPTSSFNVL